MQELITKFEILWLGISARYSQTQIYTVVGIILGLAMTLYGVSRSRRFWAVTGALLMSVSIGILVYKKLVNI